MVPSPYPSIEWNDMEKVCFKVSVVYIFTNRMKKKKEQGVKNEK